MPPKEQPLSSDTQAQSSATAPPVPPMPPPPQSRPRPPPERVEDDRTPSESGSEDESRNVRRLKVLANMLRRERSAIRVTNASFETGRPPLQPTEDMRGDVTNMYHRPSTDMLWGIKPKKVSNNMATTEDVVKIQVTLEGMGVPTEMVRGVLTQLCIRCASTSSSSYQDPHGTFEWDGGAIMSDDVVGTVNEIAGLRRLCRLFAPVTWNYMHVHKTPPSDWAAMGFSYNTRYAAFDCFDYVENEAAIKPAGGVVPRPTRAEYVAYQTYKRMAVDRANNNDTYGNYDSAITGGRQGPDIERNMNNANNRRQ